MAKKGFIKDLNNIEILPITRGELILDSSGNLAFHSNEFLATDSLPGLMSKEDKAKLDNFNGNGTTIDLVSTTTDGLAPKIGTEAASTVTTQADEWVLTSTKGATPTWRKLPTNAFLNYYRPIQVNGTYLLENNNTALNIVAGNDINLETYNNVVRINNSYKSEFTVTQDGWYRLVTVPAGAQTVKEASNWKDRYITVDIISNSGGPVSASFKIFYSTLAGWGLAWDNECICIPLTYTNYSCVDKVRLVTKAGIYEKYIEVYLKVNPESTYTGTPATSLKVFIDSNINKLYLASSAIAGITDISGYELIEHNAFCRNNKSVGGLISEKAYKDYNGNIIHYTYATISSVNNIINGITPVGSANKLTKPVKLWGQEFDGSNDVSGKLLIESSSWNNYLELHRTDSDAGAVAICFYNTSGLLGSLGVHGSGGAYPLQPVFINKKNQNYKIWHSGNLTNLSQLTDDVVSGKYLPLSGGTLSGDLKWEPGAGQKSLFPGHYYHNFYPAGPYVYIHFYPNTQTTSYAIFRTADAVNDTFKELIIGGDGKFTWDNKKVLHEGNYNNYAPKLDGTGATGNWNINITGNAATSDKLKTKVKLWGNDFDGSLNISETITINSNRALMLNALSSVTTYDFVTTALFLLPNLLTGHSNCILWGKALASGQSAGLVFKYNEDKNENLLSLGFYSDVHKFNIKGNGNVGIGTMTPMYKLDVNGNTNINGSLTATTFLGNLDWSYITNKPATFTPEAHDHKRIISSDDSYVGIEAAALPSSYAKGVTFNTCYSASWPTIYGNVLTLRGRGDSQIYVSWSAGQTATVSNVKNEIYFRSKRDAVAGDQWSDWTRVITDRNYSEYCAPKIHTHTSDQITALTGYTKATSASDLVTTDTLNIALGKLEYKAGIAYSWYRTITEDDTDEIINKWDEVVDFINGLEVDLLDEFVTRKTELIITGKKTFSGSYKGTLIVHRSDKSDGNSVINFSNTSKTLGYIGVSGSAEGIGEGHPIFVNKTTAYKIWHGGNDGADSGLDADLLDGKHATEFFLYRNWNASNDYNTIRSNGIFISNPADNASSINTPHAYSNILSFGTGKSTDNFGAIQISFSNATNLCIRNLWDSNWSLWKQIAFTDSDITGNAATATRLQTPRKIWGNDFDGTLDVYQDLMFNHSYKILWRENTYADAFAIYPEFAGVGDYNKLIIASSVGDKGVEPTLTPKIAILGQSGNIGIGTVTPAQKLEVVGNTILNGNVGIGTIDISYQLNVKGDTNLKGKVFVRNDASMAIYSEYNSRYTTDWGKEVVAILTAFDNLDPITSEYPTSLSTRCVLALQPRGGFIGIGTTSPTDKVEINGGDKSMTIKTTAVDALKLYRTQAGGSFIVYYPDNQNTDCWRIGAGTGNSLAMVLYINSLEIYRLYINNSGNVGIGTSAPNLKLSVIGNVYSLGYFLVRDSKVQGTSTGLFSLDYNDAWTYRIKDVDETTVKDYKIPHYGYTIGWGRYTHTNGTDNTDIGSFISDYFGLKFHVGNAGTMFRFGYGSDDSLTWGTTLYGDGRLRLQLNICIDESKSRHLVLGGFDTYAWIDSVDSSHKVMNNIIMFDNETTVRNLRPQLNNSFNLGTTSYRWLGIYGNTLDLSLGFTAGGSSYITAAANIPLHIKSTSKLEASIRYTGTGGTSWIAGTSTKEISDTFGIWSNTLQDNVITCYSSGDVKIKGKLTSTNFISTVVTGTQPYLCTSTTLNTNLNADMLDGIHANGLLTDLSSGTTNKVSITVGGTTKNITTLYASYLCSVGVVAPLTGRTLAYGDVYSYRTKSEESAVGAPTRYTAVIGFGRGNGGTVEICGEWTSDRGLWARALRDTTDDWYDWDRILTEATYKTVLDSRYYTESEINTKLATYLPLAGGTMTGNIKLMNNSCLFGDVAHKILLDNNGYLTVYSINNGTVLGAFGDGTTSNIATYIRSTGDNLYHRKGNYNSYNDYKIWDSGNDGSGSGLDADLLDGYHISVTSSPGTDSSTLYFVL